MSLALTVTPEQAEHMRQTGVLLVTMPGGRCEYCAPEGFYEVHKPKLHPPSLLVEAAKPCETCKSTLTDPGWVYNIGGWTDPCPDCHNGKRRITVQVPCPNAGMFSGRSCRACVSSEEAHGHVAVGTVVHQWGPLVVVRWHGNIGSDPALWLDTSMDGTWVLSHWDGETATDIMSETCGGVDLPPGVGPASLVGQYAAAFEALP